MRMFNCWGFENRSISRVYSELKTNETQLEKVNLSFHQCLLYIL